jgi:hypothetical protein
MILLIAALYILAAVTASRVALSDPKKWPGEDRDTVIAMATK